MWRNPTGFGFLKNVLAVRNLREQTSPLSAIGKFYKRQTFIRPIPILVGRFYFGVFARWRFNWGWRGSFSE